MELVKLIVFFLFIKVHVESITVNNTIQIEYNYLKKNIVNVCSEFFKRSFCVWNPSKYIDLQTLILRECYNFIPVLQYSDEQIINECNNVMIIEESKLSVCELILRSTLVKIFSIAIITNKTIDDFLNENRMCSAFFDSMSVVVISLQSKEMRLVDTTVSSMHFLVRNGEIERNKILTIIPNFQGKLIKVATFHFPPFSIVKNSTLKVKYNGLEMNIFLKMARYLNFTWEFVPLKSPGGFGLKFPNGTYEGGLNQALRDGAADIGFCNIWQQEPVTKNMEFGPALNMIYVTFIVRRPYQLFNQWQNFFLIFTVSTWLIIAATFIAITLVYWKACNVMPVATRKPSLVESIMMMFGILTVSSSYTVPVSLSSRLITMWSFLFALLFMTAVTSCIVTRLTLPLYSARVNTVKQLVEGDYFWTDPSYYTSNRSLQDFYFDMSDEWHRKFESRYVYIPPKELESHIVMDRKIVLPAQRYGLEQIILKTKEVKSSTDLGNFRVMRGYTGVAFTSFGYRRYSGYNEAFNRIMQHFIELGLWEYQKHIMTFSRHNRKDLLEENDKNEFSRLQHLALEDLYPAFILLIIGISVALTIFLLEFIYYILLNDLNK